MKLKLIEFDLTIDPAHPEAGFITIDAMAGLVVFMFLIAGMMWYADWGQKKVESRVVADHLEEVIKASLGYVKDNYTTIEAAATATSAATITMEQLRTGNYLPAGFAGTNGWGQSYGIYALQPSAGDLQVVVLTFGGRTHANSLPDFANATVPNTAAMVGGAGGFIPTGTLPGQPTTSLQGSKGGWSLDLSSTDIPQPEPGHLGAMVSLKDGNLAQDYLYRVAVPGKPELNRMETYLDMNDHDVDNTRSVQLEHHTIDEIICNAANEGRMFLDRDEGVYVCRNGEPEVLGDTGNTGFFKNATVVTHNSLVEKPACPRGVASTPEIFVTPAYLSQGPDSKAFAAYQSWATDAGTDHWQVHLRVLVPRDDGNGGEWIYPPAQYGKLLVFTRCARNP